MRKFGLALAMISCLSISTLAQVYVISNVNVIPMNQETVLRAHDVIVEDGRIQAVIPHQSNKNYSDLEVIDGTDQFLIPGLTDMHMHFLADDRIPDEYRKHELLVPLKYGVLRGRVPIGNPELLKDKKRIGQGELIGPSLHIGSPQLAGVNWHPVFSGSIVKNHQAGFNAVRKYKEEGYEFIKITFGLNQETYQGIVDAGKELNIPIAGHVPTAVGIRQAIASGQDVEHLDQYMDAILSDDSPTKTGLSAFGLFRNESWKTVNFIDDKRVEEVITLTVNNGIWNTPTNHFFISSFAQYIPEQKLKENPGYNLVSSEVRDQLLDMRDAYWSKAANSELRQKYVEMRSYIIREIFERNGRILAGSDSPEWLNLYGSALHQELINFVEVVGLTPFGALQTATVNPARYFQSADFGTIEVGKRADLVLLARNPLEDIEAIMGVNGVGLGRNWLDKARLAALYNQAQSILRKASLRPEYKN